MRKKINIQLIGMAIVSILAVVLLMSAVFYETLRNQVQEDLAADVEMLRSADLFVKGEAAPDIGYGRLRITWIDSDGTVLYDNYVDPATMGNHSDRPEVKQAMQTGSGQSVRKSGTLNRNTYYYAVLLDNGTILRASQEARNVFSVVEKALPGIIAALVVMALVSVLLAHFLTQKLVQPIEKMASDIQNGTIEPAYRELVPFSNMIREQHDNLLKGAIMRQEFTANVSHELKTPLTAVLGYADMIESGIVVGKDIQTIAGKIRDNATRLLSLINDIIRLSELDSMDHAGNSNAERSGKKNGKGQGSADETERISFELLDLNEVAASCVENLQINAQKRGVSLSEQGSAVMVRASRDMMVELICNLCDNSIRYNNRGGWVSVRVYEENGRPVLSVADNGIGIPKEHQQRVFERFYRVDKSRSRQTGGTGLGLAIVRHIASLHGAKIELESEPDKGTQIRIVF